MPDPYLNVDGLAAASVEAMTTRLEERANHPVFASFIEEYARLAFPSKDIPVSVLEVGTGTGVVLRKLMKYLHPDSVVKGTDISRRFIDMANKILASDPDCAGKIEFLMNEGTTLPFDDASFDVIVLHTLISHVPDTEKLLSEVSRVLKPTGKIVIFEPDHLSTTFGQPDLAKMREMDFTLVSNIATHPDACRQVPRQLRSAGLKLIEHRSHVISEAGIGSFWLSSVHGYAKLMPTLNVMDPAVVEAWAKHMIESHETGTFFASGSFYTFIAGKMS
jgi:SAM-dependent methyltransferase